MPLDMLIVLCCAGTLLLVVFVVALIECAPDKGQDQTSEPRDGSSVLWLRSSRGSNHGIRAADLRQYLIDEGFRPSRMYPHDMLNAPRDLGWAVHFPDDGNSFVEPLQISLLQEVMHAQGLVRKDAFFARLQSSMAGYLV